MRHSNITNKRHYSAELQTAKQTAKQTPTTSQILIEITYGDFSCHLKANRDKLALINRLWTCKKGKRLRIITTSFTKIDQPDGFGPLTRSIRENSFRSRNQSDCRICWIPPAHELKKGKEPFSTALKIVLYNSAQTSGVVCLFVYHVFKSLRPTSRVPMFSRPRSRRPCVQASPSPGVPASPRPTSRRLRISRPRVPESSRPKSHVLIPVSVTALSRFPMFHLER